MLQRKGYCCAFLWMCSGKSATVVFLPTTTNIDNEIISYLAQLWGFQLIFFEAIDWED